MVNATPASSPTPSPSPTPRPPDNSIQMEEYYLDGKCQALDQTTIDSSKRARSRGKAAAVSGTGTAGSSRRSIPPAPDHSEPPANPCEKATDSCKATNAPDKATTQAIAKQLDPLVPGVHVTATAPGFTAFVWDKSVTRESIRHLEELASDLCVKFTRNPSTQEPAEKEPPKSPTIKTLNNHKAHEIASKLDGTSSGIKVEALNNGTDNALVLSGGKDSASAVNAFLKIIDGLDAADTVGTAPAG